MSYSRPESLRLLADHVYGHAPVAGPLRARLALGPRPLPGGAGTYEEVALTVRPEQPEWRVLVFRPAHMPIKATVVGLNFSGNHGLVGDPEIPLTTARLMNHYPGVVSGDAATVGAWAWLPVVLKAENLS